MYIYVFKKRGNEQQFNFNRKVLKRSSAEVKALKSGNIGKAKEELKEAPYVFAKQAHSQKHFPTETLF